MTGEAQTKLINPGISNAFIEDYILPDGSVRFIGTEHGRNRELFFVDRLVDGGVTEPVFFPESIGDLEFNFAGVDCKVLPLRNGDVILGINQGDCDYAPPSSLARFSYAGDVVWALSMEYFYFYYYIDKLIIIDSNILCIISDQTDTLYFDLDGNEAPANENYVVYDTVVTSLSGYYSSLGSSLYKLNDGYDRIDSLLLEKEIQTISLSGDSFLLVTTTNAVTILDASMDIIAHSDELINIDMAAASTNSVWLGQQNGNIIQLDHDLQVLDTFQINKDIQLKALIVVNDEIILGGNYVSAVGSSVFFHKTEPVAFAFDIKKDITLELVEVGQPVYYSFEFSAYPFGFNISYDDPVVKVANTGLDTIQSITVRYKEGSGCLLCESENHEWSFDSLNFYPGFEMDFTLEDFTALCVVKAPSMFCLSILPADRLPETDRINNRLCIEVNALMTGLNDIENNDWKITPNPAQNYVSVITDSPSGYNIRFIDIYGRELLNKQIESSFVEINIEHLPAGIYIVMVSEDNELNQTFKLNIVR